MSDYPEIGTLLSQALAHMEANELDTADALYRRILDFDPAHKQAIVRRIMIARLEGRRDDTLALLEAACHTDPSNPDWLVGRGLALSEIGRLDEALESYDRAIALSEECANAWFAKAQLLLQLGRYKEGWELFEWRFYVSSHLDTRLFHQPQWQGGGFHGKMLFVHAEHGLGDSIQFYRFVNQARSFGGVFVEADEPLVRLFASQPQAPLIVPREQRPPHFDLQCPMMSLPMLLGTELHSIPGEAYLRADPALEAVWAEKLPPRDGRLRIGFCWSSNFANPNTLNKIMPLPMMLELLGSESVLVSLQKEVHEANRELLAASTHVIDLGTSFADFADTAAVISQLDLVISVDTAVAHLAGAMGQPVWILLPEAAEWRWLLRREDSPWYPTARLFRQTEADNWYSVLPAVWDALRALRASRQGSG